MTLAALFALALAADQPPQDPPPAPTVSGLTVKAAKPQVETAIDRRSYAVANDLTAQSGSVADILRNIPSVQIDSDGNPSLSGAGNVTVLIDGRPSTQFSTENLAQALQSMPADRIDRIEVMTNPPAQFRADGTGGIINLVTKKAKGAGETGSVRLSAVSHDRASMTATLGYNADKLSATGDLSYRRDGFTAFLTSDQRGADPVTGLATMSQDHLVNRGTADIWQGHASADYDLDSRTKLSGSLRLSAQPGHILGNDQFSQQDGSGAVLSAFDRDHFNPQQWQSGEASTTWRQTYSEGHDLTLDAQYSGTEVRALRLDAIDPTAPAGLAALNQQVTLKSFNRRAIVTADYQQPLAGGTTASCCRRVIRRRPIPATSATGTPSMPRRPGFWWCRTPSTPCAPISSSTRGRSSMTAGKGGTRSRSRSPLCGISPASPRTPGLTLSLAAGARFTWLRLGEDHRKIHPATNCGTPSCRRSGGGISGG
jgi:outer membrane receptor for ferrienterochelin and colicin